VPNLQRSGRSLRTNLAENVRPGVELAMADRASKRNLVPERTVAPLRYFNRAMANLGRLPVEGRAKRSLEPLVTAHTRVHNGLKRARAGPPWPCALCRLRRVGISQPSSCNSPCGTLVARCSCYDGILWNIF
jgi:hypothetical protein